MAHRTTKDGEGKGLDGVIRVDEAEVKAYLGEMVRQSVEETLNGMLDAEADRLCQAKQYERTTHTDHPDFSAKRPAPCIGPDTKGDQGAGGG
jgi:hypothetical protein